MNEAEKIDYQNFKPRGWIQLHRRMLEWEWYRDIPTFKLFIHLLLKVSFQKKSWQGILISPGQVITGRKNLSAETGLSEMQIRTALVKLQKTNEIPIKTTTKYSIITVVNWVSFQEGNQQTNQSATNKHPTDNQQITTTKKGNKEKKEIKKKEEWIAPSLQEVIDFFLLNGYTKEAAAKAFKYYEVASWVDNRGNPVRSWKQKMISVWFKPEHKQEKSHIKRLDIDSGPTKDEAAKILREANITVKSIGTNRRDTLVTDYGKL